MGVFGFFVLLYKCKVGFCIFGSGVSLISLFLVGTVEIMREMFLFSGRRYDG